MRQSSHRPPTTAQPVGALSRPPPPGKAAGEVAGLRKMPRCLAPPGSAARCALVLGGHGGEARRHPASGAPGPAGPDSVSPPSASRARKGKRPRGGGGDGRGAVWSKLSRAGACTTGSVRGPPGYQGPTLGSQSPQARRTISPHPLPRGLYKGTVCFSLRSSCGGSPGGSKRTGFAPWLWPPPHPPPRNFGLGVTVPEVSSRQRGGGTQEGSGG